MLCNWLLACCTVILQSGDYYLACQKDLFWFQQKHPVHLFGWWTVFIYSDDTLFCFPAGGREGLRGGSGSEARDASDRSALAQTWQMRFTEWFAAIFQASGFNTAEGGWVDGGGEGLGNWFDLNSVV